MDARKFLLPSPRLLSGLYITSLDRHGKFLWVQCVGNQAIKIHLSSTGWLMPGNTMTWARHPTPDDMHENFRHNVDDRNIRFRLIMSNDEVWNYHDSRTWGKWQLVENVANICEDPQIQKYGPDWLKETGKAFDSLMICITKRAAKDVLTDQNISAGIGNYLAVEALHRAKIHPRRTWNTLTVDQKSNLLYDVSSFIDESLKRDDHSHWLVFEKAGQVCKTCGKGTIQYLKDGASAKRGSYFCNVCQPLNT